MYSIGPKDLIFDKNGENGIFGGGFSVNSIMMQDGISPIMTFNNNNNNKIGGGLGQVSDIFSGLAVPAYAYHNGGSKVKNNSYKNYESDDDSDEDDGVINGDLHDKLLDLVRQHESTLTQTERKKKRTRKHNGKPRKANTRKNIRKTVLPVEEE
jgi:hypothetical protein